MHDKHIDNKNKTPLQKLYLEFALIGVIILMTFLNPRFLTISNIINISRQMSINLIIGVGMTFSIISGGVDLSVGSVGIMSGCLTGITLHATNNIPLSIGVGLIAGLIFGFLNGIIIAKLKVNPFIGTLGTMVAARGIAFLTTGGYIISNFPKAFNFIGVGFVFGLPVPIIIMLIIIIFGHILLSKTEFGLNTYAIGGNYKAARLAGLQNQAVITKIYMLSGLLSSIAGIVLTARVISAQPALMTNTGLDVIAAVVIGGAAFGGGSGTMLGTIVGTILISSIFNGLNLVGVGYEWQLVIEGIIIVGAVALDMASKKVEEAHL
jgi:ribose transport system permease protein